MVAVNADNFIRAETDLMFSRLLADSGGLGRWFHYRQPASLEHPNHLYVMPGWNCLIHMYRPRPEVLDGRWTPPAIEPLP